MNPVKTICRVIQGNKSLMQTGKEDLHQGEMLEDRVSPGLQ